MFHFAIYYWQSIKEGIYQLTKQSNKQLLILKQKTVMKNQNRVNAIIEAISNMDASDLLQLNRDFCESCNYSDSEIFENDEDFFNTYFEGKPFEVARATFYGDYNFSHDYVVFNGYGNLESFNSGDIVENLAENISGIAADVLENIDAYDFDFASIIEAVEEENED